MTLTAEKFGTQTEWRTFSTVHKTDDELRVPDRDDHMNRERPKIQSDAIFTYIKALRSLGKTRVTSAEVASALGLPEREVRRAMTSMIGRGVKAI